MKKCELCGNENPDQARFCMKCGKDMDSIKSSEVPLEMLEDPATFTPVADDEYARLAPTTHAPRAPIGDVASYKEAAASAAAALQEQQEIESAHLAGRGTAPAADGPIPGSEIDQRDVTADFVGRKQFCQRCGMANHRDMRFCKNCGSSLGDAPGGAPEESFGAPPPVSMESVPVETTTLADISPSSAYSETPSAPEERAKAPRRPRRASGVAEWGVREWLAVAAASLVVVLLLWLFALGGFGALFNSRNKNIRRAGNVMQKLPGFKMQINSGYELDESAYGGGGHVLFESPDRSAWEISRDAPGDRQTQGTVAVGAGTYTGSGGQWQKCDPATSAGDVILMWKKFSNSEGMPNETFNGHTCLHYKYRMDPMLMKTVLGLGDQGAVSDVIMETWIDSTSFQVVHQTAKVFGAKINGASTRITLVMDLVEAGQPYGIKAPL